MATNLITALAPTKHYDTLSEERYQHALLVVKEENLSLSEIFKVMTGFLKEKDFYLFGHKYFGRLFNAVCEDRSIDVIGNALSDHKPELSLTLLFLELIIARDSVDEAIVKFLLLLHKGHVMDRNIFERYPEQFPEAVGNVFSAFYNRENFPSPDHYTSRVLLMYTQQLTRHKARVNTDPNTLFLFMWDVCDYEDRQTITAVASNLANAKQILEQRCQQYQKYNINESAVDDFRKAADNPVIQEIEDGLIFDGSYFFDFWIPKNRVYTSST
jgi:hypothetical protein